MTHHTICVAACSPSSQQLLTQLHTHTPQGVLLLHTDKALPEHLDISCKLLILVAQQVHEQDSKAVLATAAQLKARSFGVPIVCIATLPQPSSKSMLGQHALQALKAHVDAHILLPCDTNVDLVTWLPHGVTDMAKGLDESISNHMGIEELSNMLHGAGHAVWVSAQAQGENRALDVTCQLLSNAFEQGLQLLSAHHGIIWITASPQTLKLYETRYILVKLNQICHPDAELLCAVVYDGHLGDTVRLTVLFTDINRSSRKHVDNHI